MLISKRTPSMNVVFSKKNKCVRAILVGAEKIKTLEEEKLLKTHPWNPNCKPSLTKFLYTLLDTLEEFTGTLNKGENN